MEIFIPYFIINIKPGGSLKKTYLDLKFMGWTKIKQRFFSFQSPKMYSKLFYVTTNKFCYTVFMKKSKLNL